MSAAPAPSVSLRPATADDADLLLVWANEPTVRSVSLRTAPIDWPTHVRWLTARLASPGGRIWIGLGSDGTPLGVVRVEIEPDGMAAVSITVAPAARGQGVGRGLLAAGLAAARTELAPRAFRARVRSDNATSLALFRSAGFTIETGPVSRSSGGRGARAGQVDAATVVDLVLDASAAR
jgi:UDP-2,4-diacetamido-2,4,6-trideoxy-beta-L-altropyranose hydrolase